jgi:hypothetical protein
VIYASGKSGTDTPARSPRSRTWTAQGVKGIAITPTSPAVSAALDKGDQVGRQGDPDGQRHSRLEEQDGGRRDQ